MSRFSIKFLNPAIEFLDSLDSKERDKIIYNLNKASRIQDKSLFKKLTDEIWEFRTLYNKTQFRLLAFWDKTGPEETLVIVTHGFIKKTQKTPKAEIKKAEELLRRYFSEK